MRGLDVETNCHAETIAAYGGAGGAVKAADCSLQLGEDDLLS